MFFCVRQLKVPDLYVYIVLQQEWPIYSVMWKPAGRRLEMSARIVNGSVQGEIYPNMKYGLNGRKVVVVTKVVCFSNAGFCINSILYFNNVILFWRFL